GADHPRRVDDGGQTGQAHRVDRAGGHIPADAGADRGLTGGVLPGPGREHLTHDDRFDVGRRDGGLLERTTDRERPQLRGGERRQLTLQPPLRGAGRGDDDDVAHDFSFRFSETDSAGSVASMTSCTLTPGAVSTSTSPSGVTSMTARSVMMRSTTPLPVSGREHSSTIFAEPSLATCSMRMMTRPAPCTRSMAPPGPLTIFPGIIQFARSPFTDTCVAPRIAASILPPRIMPKLVAESKNAAPGSRVTAYLPALMRSGSTFSSVGYGPTPRMPFSDCSTR